MSASSFTDRNVPGLPAAALRRACVTIDHTLLAALDADVAGVLARDSPAAIFTHPSHLAAELIPT
jgi:hypothetical protein